MATPKMTRESLIEELLREIASIDDKSIYDRSYILDLVAEIANASDGKRPDTVRRDA